MSRSALMSAATSAGGPANRRCSPSPACGGAVSPNTVTRKLRPTALGSRPASAVILRRRATWVLKRVRLSSGFCGLVPIGYHASPMRAARRSAGPLSPPTQIGGCGFCTGFGSKPILENRTCLPSNFGASLVQSSTKARTYSSVTVPRASKSGASMASNSSRIQPAPIPSVSRPPERTSMVERILAVSTAGRCGTTMTEVTRRRRVVFAAIQAISVSCSCRSPRVPLGNSPEAL